MSHLTYNPFAPGKPNASQGQLGIFSGKTEGDHRRTTPKSGVESSFSFFGASCCTDEKTEIKPISLQVIRNQPENHLTTPDNNLHRIFNIPLKQEMEHRAEDEPTFVNVAQENTSFILAPKASTCPVLSASYGHQLSSTSSHSSSSYWLPGHDGATEYFLKSTSNTSVHGTSAVFQRPPSEPGYISDKTQLAESILQNYGLDKADLDELLGYSEEQTTANNLPYLLENIRMKKSKGAPSEVQSKPTSLSQPAASTSRKKAGSIRSSSTLQPMKETLNEQTFAWSVEVEATNGRNTPSVSATCGNSSLVNDFQTSGQIKDWLFPSFSNIKSAGLNSLDYQEASPIASPPGIDQLQPQPNQTSEMTQLIGFGQTRTPQNKRPNIFFKPIKQFDFTEKSINENDSSGNIHDTASIGRKTLIIETKKAPQLNSAELIVSSLVSSDYQNASLKSNLAEHLETPQNYQTQSVSLSPQSNNRDATFSGESEAQGQGDNITEAVKNRQLLQKANIQTVLRILQTLQPAVLATPSSPLPKEPDVSPVSPSGFMSKNPSHLVSQFRTISNADNAAKTGNTGALPSMDMMHDYAAVIPRRFSHTCSLCKTKSANLKDWSGHQATYLHRVNCKRLRDQYPNWNGVVPSLERNVVRSVYTLPSSFLHRQKSGHDSRSRSHSNGSSCSSCGDGEYKFSSRSHSLSYSSHHQSSLKGRRCRSTSSAFSHSHHHSSKNGRHKSRSNAHLHSPSHNRSGQKRNRLINNSSSDSYSPRRHCSNNERNGSNCSSCKHQLQCRISRSRSRSCSPCLDRSARSFHRPRSKSFEEQSSPKQTNRKSSSPRKNLKWKLSRGRSHERQSPPRRDTKGGSKRFLEGQSSTRTTTISDNRRLSPVVRLDRQFSPVRTDYKPWLQRRNHEQLFPRNTNHQRLSPIRSCVQQPSLRHTDDRPWSPLRTNDRLWSPQRSIELQSFSSRDGDRRLSPMRKYEPPSPLRRKDNRLWSTHKNVECLPPRRIDIQQWSPTRSIQGTDQLYTRVCPTRDDVQQWLAGKIQRQKSSQESNKDIFLPKQIEEVCSLKRSRKRRASLGEEPSSEKKKSSSVQNLTKQLLEKSAVQSRKSKIKAVVNEVVPVLLAELTKNQDSSMQLLVIPSRGKKRMVLTPSSIGSKSSHSSTKIKSKLKWIQDSVSTKDLCIITEDQRKQHKLRARVTSALGLCNNLDVLPIKTLLSLHQKLIRKEKRLSSHGSHTSTSKAHSLKRKTLKSVTLKNETSEQVVYNKSQSLDGKPRICPSKTREHTVSRKAPHSKVGAKQKTKKIAVSELNKRKGKVKGQMAGASKPSVPNVQEVIRKTQETSVKALPKVPKKIMSNLDPKKSKLPGKNRDSGDKSAKPATNELKKERRTHVAVKNKTKVGKMLGKTAAKAKKVMTTKVKVNPSKISAVKKPAETGKCTRVVKRIKVEDSQEDTLQLGKTTKCSSECRVTKASETASAINTSTCDQLIGKEIGNPPELPVIISTLPVTENSPKPEISETNVLQFINNESQLQRIKEVEAINVSSENTHEVFHSIKTESSEIKFQQSAILSEDFPLVVANVSTAEITKRTEVTADNGAMETVKSNQTFAPERTAVVVQTKMHSLVTEGDQANNTIAPPPTPKCSRPGIPASDKPSDPTQTLETSENLVKAVTQVQPKVIPNPDLAARNPKTSGDELEQAPETSAEASLGAVRQTRDCILSETQNNLVQNRVCSNRAPSTDSAITSSNIETVVTPNRTETSRTIGENLACYMNLRNFNCVRAERIFSSNPLTFNSNLLIITHLPEQSSCSYSEEEVVNLLCTFGFQYSHQNIYIVPQMCMAFVLMPNKESVLSLMFASVKGRLSFKGKKLLLHVVQKEMFMTPLGFYESVMESTPLNKSDGTNVIYIQNISLSDAAYVRKALRRIGRVRNVLPLLYKVFVEFETVYDADRLGVWYSLMRTGFVHTVSRLKLPQSTEKSRPPQLPLNALPDIEDKLPDAGIPNVTVSIPQGTTAPFWVTMMTSAYIFPTVCPWFDIPCFLTVQEEDDILTAPESASEFFTVMLTGLPEGKYKHEDVAKLVCHYFREQNLQTLYYNIVVLPLQRRAFVFFPDWETCCSFVSDCIKKPVSVKNCRLTVHLVLEDVRPGCSEETMYRSLMKWSSGYVPELFLLEERMVCVETHVTDVDLIQKVMTEVDSIASFVSFVPLANRICIEMVSPSCATKVLQEMPWKKSLSPYLWSRIGRIESVKDLNCRLKETSEIKRKLEEDKLGVNPELIPGRLAARFPLPEPCNDVANAESALPETASESNVALDPETEETQKTHDCQPCNETATTADSNKKTQMCVLSKTVGSLPAESTDECPSVKTEATAEEVAKEQPSGLDSCLTAGERIGSLLQPQNICCLTHNINMSPKPFSLRSKLLLITNLPPCQNTRYTESCLSNLLHSFGFRYQQNNIYVIPQACLAFVLMATYQNAQDVFMAAKQSLVFYGYKLCVEIVSGGIVMTPFAFYKSIMATINYQPVTNNGTNTIYVKNISQTEASDLRETLRKIGSVKNYLPLLNKVFIEFAPDADQIELWDGLLKRRFGHNVHIMRSPKTNVTSLPALLAARLTAESKNIVAGSVAPAMFGVVPEGSHAPFSVTMTKNPFLLSTGFPLFNIPKFKTVCMKKDLLTSVSVASKFSAIMLTGLPQENYNHEDFCKVVWKYFSEQNLKTLFYNIVVLPLQRRAFVYFHNWLSCHNFVEDSLKTAVCFKGNKLHVHLVLEKMGPWKTEVMMYHTLMKWSNSHVPKLKSLHKRLVCVELSEISLKLIVTTVKLVTAICPIVGFLPLANRLCIEMSKSQGVNQVVKRFALRPKDWINVRSVESVKSLQKRHKVSKDIKLTLELDADDVSDKNPFLESEPQPPPNVGIKTKPAVQEVTNLPSSDLVTEILAAEGSGTREKMEGPLDMDPILSPVSGKTWASSGENDQCNKKEQALRASQTQSTSAGQSTSSPSKSKEIYQLDKHGAKLTGIKADHRVSSESCTAKPQLGLS